MSQFAPTPLTLRLKIAALLAIAGGLVAVVIFHLNLGMTRRELFGIWGAAILGAGLAGLATAAFFGQPGGDRHIWAVLGAVLSTALGAALGGLIYFVPPSFVAIHGTLRIEDVYQIVLFSPMVVGFGLLSITAGPVWVLLMSLVHVIAGRMRQAA